MTLTAALPADKVRRAPAYMEPRIAWARGIAATAWGDRDALVRIPLDGGALTPDELGALGPLVEHLHVLHQRWRDARATGTTAAPGSDAARELDTLRTEQRSIQKKLLDAFAVRFKKDTASRALLSDIRKGSGDADLVSDTVRILRLCNSTEHRDWLARMPKGEAAAAARLATLHKDFCTRLQRDARDPSTLKDLLDRAWTLCALRLERVLDAGRYHVSDNPAREDDYAGFRQPAARKPRAKKPAPTPAAPPANPQ